MATDAKPSHADQPASPSLDQRPTRSDSVPPLQRTPPPGGDGGSLLLAPGVRPVADYELVKLLGRGGFGEVWQAAGPGGFAVALKFIRLDLKSGKIELRSLELMKDIRHPHLLAMHGAWQRDQLLIIAMELGDRTLYDRLYEAEKQGLGGIPPAELLEHMRDAARGIDHLNKIGIQHRDIKPQNMLLVGDGIKLADFGLAKLLEQTLTSNSGALTPAYAAPEFFSGQTSGQSDQYALAVSYCQLRGGKLPFGGSLAQMMAGHLTLPPDLSMLPEGERPAVARALAKKPEERWPSCRAFVEALAQGGSTGFQPVNSARVARVARPESAKGVEDGPWCKPTPFADSGRATPALAPTPPWQTPTRTVFPTVRRRPWKTLAACLLLLLLVSAAGLWFWIKNNSSDSGNIAQNEAPEQAAPQDPAPRDHAVKQDPKPPVREEPRAIVPPQEKPVPIERPKESPVPIAPSKVGDQYKAQPIAPPKEKPVPIDPSKIGVQYKPEPIEPPKEEAKPPPVPEKKPDPTRAVFRVLPIADVALEAGEKKKIEVRVEGLDRKKSYKIEVQGQSGGVGAIAEIPEKKDQIEMELSAAADAPAATKTLHLSVAENENIVKVPFQLRVTRHLKDSTEAQVLVNRGNAWSEKKDYDKAMKDYDEAIRLDPKNALAFKNRGNAWSEKKDYDKAMKDYDEAIRLDPKYAHAFNNRGNIWSEKKEYEKAIKDYDEAIRIDPKFAQAFGNRGYLWLEKKEYDKAIKDLDEAIRLDPKNPQVFEHRGYARSQKQEYDKAIQDYNEAIRLNPKEAQFFGGRGYAWIAKKEYDKAIKDLDETIRLDPKEARAFYLKASCYALQDKIDLAIENLHQCLELGYRDFEAIEKNSALRIIRYDPRYHERYEELLKKYAK